MAVPEALLRATRFGLVPDGEGWFVINAAETRWRDYGSLGVACDFQGKRPFKQLGININVLDPSEPMSMYHRENHQEAFLMLAGECVPDRRRRRASAQAVGLLPLPRRHGTRDHRCRRSTAVVLAVGARGGRKGIMYLAEPAALNRGAGVKEHTTKSAEAYARFPRAKRCLYRPGWLPRFQLPFSV